MPITFSGGSSVLNAQRRVSESTSALGKVFERLSSGQRINRASDDAAGLAIADNLRKDSRLYTTAIGNLNDGISVTTVASSALQSQLETLQRMSELAEQSANGTFSTTQRITMQAEYRALVDEYARIGDSTSFNGQALLRSGYANSIGDMFLQAGITGAVNSRIGVSGANTGSLTGNIIMSAEGFDPNWVDGTVGGPELLQWVNILVGGPGNRETAEAIANGQLIEVRLRNGSTGYLAFNSGVAQGAGFGSGDTSAWLFTVSSNGSWVTSGYQEFNTGLSGAADVTSLFNGQVDISNLRFYEGVFSPAAQYTSTAWGTVSADGQYTASVLEATNVLSVESARAALTFLNTRREELSQAIGRFGASQSRITSALSLLFSQREAAQGAESRIRDTDIASESAQLVRQQILQQAGVSVLAQAGQQSALVLKLLP